MFSGVGSAISGTQQCPHPVFLCKPSLHLDTDLPTLLLCPSARGPGCRGPPSAGVLSIGARADYSYPLCTSQLGKVLRVTQLCPEGGRRATGARSLPPVEPHNRTCIQENNRDVHGIVTLPTCHGTDELFPAGFWSPPLLGAPEMEKWPHSLP